MAAAQDTGGEAAAGEHYDAAGATYVSLLDPAHAVTRAFGMVNVPSAVWIDEQGRIVRPPETAWTQRYEFGSMVVGVEPYAEALRDWVARGPESSFAMSPGGLREALRPRNPGRPLADAEFALAVHLYAADRAEEAAPHFLAAQGLDPDNWNYHRQPWSFDPSSSGQKFANRLILGGRPYYDPPAIRAGDAEDDDD